MVTGMSIVPYQACVSHQGWHPVEVASSNGDDKYVVLVSPWSVNESICQCDGYKYRGHCRHQAVAAKSRCDWTDFQEESQSAEERLGKICPRCGGQTDWKIEVFEERYRDE